MIVRPTVLVFGAGASYSYGFPLGGELASRIHHKLRGGGDPLYGAVCNAGASVSHISAFARDFPFSGAQSLDEFVESRRDLLDLVKLAIVYELVTFEREETLITPSTDKLRPDFYVYLLRKVLPPRPEDLQQNKRRRRAGSRPASGRSSPTGVVCSHAQRRERARSAQGAARWAPPFHARRERTAEAVPVRRRDRARSRRRWCN
jgi:hypothetical protein